MSGETREFEETTYRTLKWHLIPFLMLCYVVSYLDRVNVGFAKLQMQGDLHFSDTTYGIGAGIFFVGYILCGVPSNLMLHRVGAKAWIAFIMLIWGVLSGLLAFVTTPAQFFVLRLLLGAAEAGFNPGVILYLTYWFPGARRARTVSMFQSAIPISGVVGGRLAGWILDRLNGDFHQRGWQWLFLIEAIPAVILAVSVWCYLDNGIDQARWLTSAQKAFLRRRVSEEGALKEHSSVSASLGDVRIWRLSSLALGLVIGVYAVSFWMPTLLKDAGTRSNTEVGWLSAIPNLIAIPVMLLFARSSDLKRERRWHVASASLLGGLGLVCTALFSHHLVLTLLSLSLATAGLISAIPMQWSFVTAFLGGASGAAAIGLQNSVSNLGGLISPPLIGWLKDRTGSVETGLTAIAGCAVVSAVIALTLPARLVDR